MGGAAALGLQVSVPSGTRSMSVWLNGSLIRTLTANSTDDPRPTGSEFMFKAFLDPGENTVELRDTEGTAELDVIHARISPF